MNRNPNKVKRINSRNNEKVSIRQKQIRNENEKRRRNLFVQLINNLEKVISTQENSSSNEENKLSKNVILRQTVSYLEQHRQYLTSEAKLLLSNSNSSSSKINEILNIGWKPPCDLISIEEWLEIAIESMHCFFLVVSCQSKDNPIVYVSNNINRYLGYSQDQLINHSLFEFIHSSDHQYLRNYLQNNHQVLEKCNVYWKELIHDQYEHSTIIGAFRKINENEKYFISIVQLNSINETLFLNNQHLKEPFLTHINNQGKFIFINSKTEEYLGYNALELIGRTYFDFVHPDDLPILTRAHQLWKTNENGQSDPYRFLTKGQQWIYLQTSSQVKLNSWTGKADFYICTNSILQCSTDSLPKQLTTYIQTSNLMNIFEDVDECSPVVESRMSLSSSPKKCSSAENEITAFLSDLDNEISRQSAREKLTELRKSKEDEIRVRQDEIQVIDDILQFINQYQMKQLPSNTIHQSRNLTTEENILNIFDTNSDLTLLNSPFSGTIGDVYVQTNSKDGPINDPLLSLFSPSTFNLLSPLTPFSNPSSNNYSTQDILRVPTTTDNPSIDKLFSENPSIDKLFSENPFP